MSRDAITQEQVREIARLARLSLDPAEVRSLADEMEAIVTCFEELETVDLATEPDPPAAATALREDTPRPGLPQDSLARLAPRIEQGHFVVPRILD